MTHGTRQHRVPASVLARLGDHGGSPSRDTPVGVLRLRDGRGTFCSTAEKMCREKAAYDAGDGTTVDDLWAGTEPHLGWAIDTLEQSARRMLEQGWKGLWHSDRRRLRDSANVVKDHVAEQLRRHEGFDLHFDMQGLTRDQVQQERVEHVRVGRETYRRDTHEMHVLLVPEQSPLGLVTNDWGFVELTGDESYEYVPLGNRIGVAMSREQRDGAGLGVVPVTPDRLEQLRAAMVEARPPEGAEGPRFAVGHPADPLFA